MNKDDVKIGQYVEVNGESYTQHWKGVKGIVVAIDELINIKVNQGSTYSDGSPILQSYIDATAGFFRAASLNLIKDYPDNTELEELREFKRKALEQYPSLQPNPFKPGDTVYSFKEETVLLKKNWPYTVVKTDQYAIYIQVDDKDGPLSYSYDLFKLWNKEVK